ncbi:MAG: sphingomyelin synthase family protein [archaeon]|nr:sphingomyelin synthase family protein [archaeon]
MASYLAVRRRIHGEVRILFSTKSWLVIFLGLVDLLFFSSVFRNIAYMRNEQSPPLKDLGWEMIPKIPQEYRYLSEVSLSLVTFLALSLPAVVVCYRPVEQTLSALLLIDRWVVFNAIGHFLRAITFLSTSLPAPSDFCQSSPDYNPPQELGSVFISDQVFVLIQPNGSCGDLLFSGHMLMTLSSTLMVFWYSNQVIFPAVWLPRAWQMIATGCALIQPLLILGSRHHYTVDIVVALYTVPMLWVLYTRYVGEPLYPIDLLPIKAAGA